MCLISQRIALIKAGKSPILSKSWKQAMWSMETISILQAIVSF